MGKLIPNVKLKITTNLYEKENNQLGCSCIFFHRSSSISGHSRYGGGYGKSSYGDDDEYHEHGYSGDDDADELHNLFAFDDAATSDTHACLGCACGGGNGQPESAV